MRVSRVTPFLADLGGGKNLCFVKVETEHGPHGWGERYNSTTVGLAATLRVSAAIPNLLITEYFVNFEGRGREVAQPPIEVRNGYVAVPTRSGLGVDLGEAALRSFPGRQFRTRPMPAPRDE